MEYIEHPLDVSPCIIEGFVLFSMFDVVGTRLFSYFHYQEEGCANYSI